MLRFILSTIALVGALETARPAFADPSASVAADPVQAAATVAVRPLPPAPASSTDGAASTDYNKDIAPAGLGWG